MNHEFYMKLAIQNAEAMRGQTFPNPLVGAVIVNDNRIVGMGAHLKAGEPHAEIHALRIAGEKAKGSTVYVTLEPCSHYGRTGPCALALVEAGVEKVVVAALDPNPLVAGNGIKILRDAGIEVIAGILAEESRRMNEVFNKYIVTKMPFVIVKSAITLDGKVATHTSDSKWITSEQARHDVHVLRNEHPAILVGMGTVLQDNPELTTRIPNGRNPVRVILDSTLRIPPTSKVVTDQKAETWVFTSQAHSVERKKQLEEMGVKVIVTNGEGKVDLTSTLKFLGGRGLSSVLVEGGGEVNASFLEQKLVDKIVLYIAPKLVGGRNAPTFMEGAGVDKMKNAFELTDLHFVQIGRDLKIVGYPLYGNNQ